MLGKAKAQTTRSDAAEARLRGLADRLSAADAAALRHDRFQPADFAALVAGIAAEIDETVLPRTIALIEGDTTLASLTVSNRRLVGFATADGQEVLSEERAAGDVAGAVLDRLKGLTRLQGPFTLCISGRADEFSAAGSSCSAADLTQAVSRLGDGKALVNFYRKVRSLAEASLFIDDTRVVDAHEGEGPAKAMLAALHRECVTKLDDNAALRRAFVKPSCTVLPMPGGRRALLGVDKKTTLLAVVDESRLGDAIAAWRRHFPI